MEISKELIKTAKKARNRYMSGMIRFFLALLAGFAAVMAMALYMDAWILVVLDFLVVGANFYTCKDLFILWAKVEEDISKKQIVSKEVSIVDAMRDEKYCQMAGTNSIRSFFPDGGERFFLVDEKEIQYRIVSKAGIRCSKQEPVKGTMVYLQESKVVITFNGEVY